MNRALIGGLAALALISTGCGENDDTGSAASASEDVTHEEWFADICAEFAALGEPAFDGFFTDSPEPTLDDWAAFLPEAITYVEDLAGTIESTPHAAFDAAEELNQGTATPAMEAAFAAVDERDCPAPA